jgi:hypothetical protein
MAYILRPRDLTISHLHLWAPFVSLITKCNLPYKYTKNYLQGCSDGVVTV